LLIAIAAATDFNTWLNIIALVALGLFSVPFLRSRRKDGIIAEQKQTIDSKDALLLTRTEERDECQQRVRQIEQGAGHLKEELARMEARYDEQSHYTAQGALEAVMKLVEQGDRNQERRHKELMGALHVLTSSVER
jgi:hypothetical protein